MREKEKKSKIGKIIKTYINACQTDTRPHYIGLGYFMKKWKKGLSYNHITHTYNHMNFSVA